MLQVADARRVTGLTSLHLDLGDFDPWPWPVLPTLRSITLRLEERHAYSLEHLPISHALSTPYHLPNLTSLTFYGLHNDDLHVVAYKYVEKRAETLQNLSLEGVWMDGVGPTTAALGWSAFFPSLTSLRCLQLLQDPRDSFCPLFFDSLPPNIINLTLRIIYTKTTAKLDKLGGFNLPLRNALQQGRIPNPLRSLLIDVDRARVFSAEDAITWGLLDKETVELLERRGIELRFSKLSAGDLVGIMDEYAKVWESE